MLSSCLLFSFMVGSRHFTSFLFSFRIKERVILREDKQARNEDTKVLSSGNQEKVRLLLKCIRKYRMLKGRLKATRQN